MEKTISEIIDEMDFRFERIEHELELFRDSLDVLILNDQLHEIIENERAQMDSRLVEPGYDPESDEFAADNYGRALDSFIEVSIPRFYYCPMLVILYAICEAAITEIAGIIQAEKRLKLGLDEIKGGFTKRAKRYYEKVLGFEIFVRNDHWKRFKELELIRHAIAHANGRLDFVDTKNRNKIIRLSKRQAGVETHTDYVIVSQDYLSETASIIHDAMHDLIIRAMQEVPARSGRSMS